MCDDQVYSNTRVPTQVNTNQHESTRINTSLTRVNTNQTRVNKNQHECDTIQHKPDTSQHESTRVRHESTRDNTSQLDHEVIIVYRSLVGNL